MLSISLRTYHSGLKPRTHFSGCARTAPTAVTRGCLFGRRKHHPYTRGVCQLLCAYHWRQSLVTPVCPSLPAGPLPLLVAVVAVLAASSAQTSPPEVSVAGGRVRGRWSQTESSGRAVAAFEGIPYAQAPIGELRFQAPQPAKPWTDVKVADRPGAICLQRDAFLDAKGIEGSEDCLFVNVYAPTVSRTSPLPVMVFVHGGGFFFGAGHLYGPGHLLEQDVILVTFNYRLGPLGFLSTADDVIPGNYGLKDMVLALQWVRDNVRAFGGDPGRVTIFGESAGGAAVHYLMLSPLSRGLFHGVVAMSGTALAPWAYNGAETNKEISAKVSQVLGCPGETSRALADCLAGKTGAEIIVVDEAFTEWTMHPMMTFRPSAEPSGPGAFIDRSPAEVLAAGEVADVPFMTGVTSHEGCLLVVPILESPAHTKELNDKFATLGPIIFYAKHLPESVNKKIFAQIRETYFGDRAIGNETRFEFIDVSSVQRRQPCQNYSH
ncbi:hypothetical protein ONE63_003360 [Megalurothrips usitatus]|uniref:Carboxylic ester hydrolase n=1 Tax=Megalurothrips usitatus TaxID=439358 RepID=A0AAV7XA05_9NEOP|nr:hypothetical protein ONE63_003360 [Megalurothrips usitatus]